MRDRVLATASGFFLGALFVTIELLWERESINLQEIGDQRLEIDPVSNL